MSLSRLWLFLAVSLPILASLIAGMSSVDLSYHLRAGSEIIDSRALPSVDTWTYTSAGSPWVDQQWGAQVVLEFVDRLGGWSALAILRAGLVGWTFGCLLLICRRRHLDERTSAVLTLAAFFVTAVALTLRPQLFGMALFALVLLLVTDRRRHAGRLWLIPLITLVWANVHGSFFLAPLVLGLAWLEDLHDRKAAPHQTLAVGVVSAMTACVSPFGPMVWAYAIGLSTNQSVTSRITEWQPTDLRDIPGIMFFASALAVAAFLARRGRPTPWPTLAWLAVFFLIGTYAVRGVAWWPMAAVVAVSSLVVVAEAPSPRATLADMRRINAVVAGAIALVCVALLPIWRPIDRGLDAPVGVVASAPSGITQELRGLLHPGDRLFHPQRWGSWFETTFPDTLVAIDSRIELFPPDVWDQYEAVVSGAEGWAQRLDAWGVTVLVIAADDPEFKARAERSGWTATFEDPDGWVLQRHVR